MVAAGGGFETHCLPRFYFAQLTLSVSAAEQLGGDTCEGSCRCSGSWWHPSSPPRRRKSRGNHLSYRASLQRLSQHRSPSRSEQATTVCRRGKPHASTIPTRGAP